MHRVFGLRTCRERCQPGMRPQLLAFAHGSHHHLRRVVCVTNVPMSVIRGKSELRGLFRQFGPLARSNLTTLSLDDSVGFEWVAFESREDAEEAIDKLNGSHLNASIFLDDQGVSPPGSSFIETRRKTTVHGLCNRRHRR